MPGVLRLRWSPSGGAAIVVALHGGQVEPAMTAQQDKAERFRALHRRDGAFLIPNPWDVGSARLLEGLGFEALATTSRRPWDATTAR